MADQSKTRMNLAAIKKVDPFAKDIVASSSHVAFYIFNSDKNEWEKTDVEGAFFIYSRNAQPFHSIFINNRLNTTSFVEPITYLELQAQAPFLLYRNERSRIRGFWFYNSDECDRVSKLVSELVHTAASPTNTDVTPDFQMSQAVQAKENNNVNIFNMLSNAQQEYNNSQNHGNNHHTITTNTPQQQQQQHQPINMASGNVLKFFESAKPTVDVGNYAPRILPNTLSVEQLEKQQRDIAPNMLQQTGKDDSASYRRQQSTSEMTSNRLSCSLLESAAIENSIPRPGSGLKDVKPILNKGPDFGFVKALNAATCSPNNIRGEQISLSKIFTNLNLQQTLSQPSHATETTTIATNKPALMPPTMFDKPASHSAEPLNLLTSSSALKSEPLNKLQFAQAFNYLMQTDEDFVQKLHEAYLKTVTKFGTTYQ